MKPESLIHELFRFPTLSIRSVVKPRGQGSTGGDAHPRSAHQCTRHEHSSAALVGLTKVWTDHFNWEILTDINGLNQGMLKNYLDITGLNQ